MKLRRVILLSLALLMGGSATLYMQAQEKKRYATYGVAFYNLENLFDTINNNGKYDKEFSPSDSYR